MVTMLLFQNEVFRQPDLRVENLAGKMSGGFSNMELKNELVDRTGVSRRVLSAVL
jgi:hypothetical protein